MKVKKLIAIVSCLAMVAAMNVSVFAAGNIGDSDTKTIGSNSGTADTEIPVWGYVGPEADIDPTDPPTEPPAVDLEIDVTVPVVMLWAAFDAASYNVTSPTYKITNNSSDVNVDVVGDFAEVNGQGITFDAAAPLTIGMSNGTDIELHDTNVNIGTLNAANNWTMGITGTVEAASVPQNSDYVQPEYALTLTFTVAP